MSAKLFGANRKLEQLVESLVSMVVITVYFRGEGWGDGSWGVIWRMGVI